MPINTTHPHYDQHAQAWQDCRDAAAGWRKVKEQGTRYLPRLSEDQDSTEYKDYKTRAYFLEAFARTTAALTGAVTQKPATLERSIDTNARLNAWLENVTGQGDSLDDFAGDVLAESLEVSRQGIYVTMQAEPSTTAMPRFVQYTAEQIINWYVRPDDGEPTLVVLMERAWRPDPDDLYKWVQVDQWRELRLGGSGLAEGADPGTPLQDYPDNQFIVNIWEETNRTDNVYTDDRYHIVETIVPRIGTKALDYIPFIFCNASHTASMPEAPIYAGLVEAIYDHYRVMADYRHGLSITGLPTAYFFGEGATGDKLYIGSRGAWTSEDPNSKAGMIEYTGQGLTAMVEALNKAEHTIAFLGARLLSAPRQQIEATETHRIRQQAEQVTIVDVANTVSAALTKAIRFALQWATLAIDVDYKLNTDVTNTRLQADEINALLAAVQAGQMSFDTFYYNLQQGEIARPGIEAAEEKELLEMEPLS